MLSHSEDFHSRDLLLYMLCKQLNPKDDTLESRCECFGLLPTETTFDIKFIIMIL